MDKPEPSPGKLGHYYNEDTDHRYMNIEKSDLLIIDHFQKMNLDKSTVLELGPGFGRYTIPLASLAEKVIASEPNYYMFSCLKKALKDFNNVTIINKSIEDLVDEPCTATVDHIVLVHVLHHLPFYAFAALRRLAEILQADVSVIEPNHHNPLFFFQIFATKGMNFKEESRMLTDNSAILAKENFNDRFSINRKFSGIFPPFLTNSLAGFFPVLSNSRALSTKTHNPFSAYSIMTIKKMIK